MKYYVYALIDPETKEPFYIGKGLYERIRQHFIKIYKGKTVYGVDPSLIIEDEKHSTGKSSKKEKIFELMDCGYKPEEIARIIAKNLDEYSAFAMESFLIKYVYGISNLNNAVYGEHSERFRGHNTLNDFIEGFDPVISQIPQLYDNAGKLNQHYVYALVNPETCQPFYIGKGFGNRIWMHFNSTENFYTEKSDAIEKISGKGFRKHEIERILAYVDNEDTAFKLESLLIHFVYGEKNLSNIVSGHHKNCYRAKDDWAARVGFDLPFIYSKSTKGNREWIKDMMLGEGLGDILDKVKTYFEGTLSFGDYELLDSRDLGIRADFEVSGRTVAKIKVFTRVIDQAQVEVRFEGRHGAIWAEEHFRGRLGYVNRRNQYVFFPDPWVKNLARGSKETINRVKMILVILNASSRESIGNHLHLLDERQQTRNREQRERFVMN